MDLARKYTRENGAITLFVVHDLMLASRYSSRLLMLHEGRIKAFDTAERVLHPHLLGDVYDVEFTQKMTLQGGEYLLSMSCTGFEGGEHVVYHRLYDVANITVISNKNTVGVYDMESEVETSLTKA